MAGSFHEVRFPTHISYGSNGGPGYSTRVIQSDSGDEVRIGRWAQARRSYDAAYGVKTHEEVIEVRDFYLARRGPLFGFRWKDFHDCTSALLSLDTSLGGDAVTNMDQEIGLGDGATKTFQLSKTYVSGSTEIKRTIVKPVSGTVVIAFDGVDQPSGWTVDTTTGIVTFTTAPALDVVVTAGFEFDVPVRFGMETDESLRASIDTFGSASINSIPLIEIRDFKAVSEGGEFSYGGACEAVISDDYLLSQGVGRVQYIKALVVGLKVYLPGSVGTEPGAPHFFIVCDPTSAFSIDVYDTEGDVFLVTLTAGQGVEAILTTDGAGDNHWICL